MWTNSGGSHFIEPDDVWTVLRITQGTFRELFPQVPPVPASTDAIEG